MRTLDDIPLTPHWSAGKTRSRCRRRPVLAWLLILLAAPGSAAAQESLLERVFRPVLSDSPQPLASQTEPPPTPQPPLEEPDASLSEKFNQAEDAEEVLPGPGDRFVVPLTRVGTPGEVVIEEAGDRITLVARDSSLSHILGLVAQRYELSIVALNTIDAQYITIALHNKTLDELLDALLAASNYTWTRSGGVIYVTELTADGAVRADLQGRRIQVFPLDYASAQAMQEAVQSFLSPVGQVFITQSQPDNNRMTQEVLVVEDLPHSLERIAVFIHEMDQPPRQVLIEAHILQVELSDDRSHGVNFEHLFSIMGNDVSLRSVENPIQLPAAAALAAGTPQAFFATVSGGNLTALIELMKTTNDVKTLASPRLLVINEQTARLQVGEKLGYRGSTTTTETSTLQAVEFLETGVILEITPRIARDNRILLRVRPEVSGGQINPTTQVPDSDTTELETNVLLDDGFGVVIGGLINETDSVIQSKIPYLGDIYLIGKLFQREEIMKKRNEIVVVLIPRVFPYSPDYADYELGNVVRTETDLFEGPLLRKDRPWQPKLPDALTNPRILRLPPVGKVDFYPAERLEMAATPQPQRAYPIPRRPGPAVPWGDGPMPAPYDGPFDEPFAPAAPRPYEPDEPSVPIEFGHDPAPAPVLASPPLSDER